jgi:lipoyl(octanoyl) transferase
MTEAGHEARLFPTLNIYHDISSRSAAINMALDEALLEQSPVPSIRFYRWNHPALSFGYFGKYLDVKVFADHRDVVRRWTGGGIVFHGDDLTYSLIIPASNAVSAESPLLIYAATHQALRDILIARGQHAELAPESVVYDGRIQTDPAVADRRYNNHACFAKPVAADVLVHGRKVAGAAQRRTRRGLLQQGSIQQIELWDGFEEQFAAALSANCKPAKIGDELVYRAQEIAGNKYASDTWLRRH